MDRDAFALMAASERDHWWFRGRRHFIARVLDTLPLPKPARLLDAGCGSGGNLALLARYGRVWGFEYDADARALAARQASALGQGPVEAGSLPDGLPFADVDFDVIGLFDVLEHLPEPVASLRALRTRTAPGGALVLTVPALPWLWGPHDGVHQHYRRYTAGTLRTHLTEAGWQVQYLSYFNTVLLPLAILQRVRERIFGYSPKSLRLSPLVNRWLFNLWRLEEPFIPARRLPIGLSLIAIASPASGS
jgi:SAM-dependent methyltransferase